jgi:hypothetical protein
MTNDKAADGIVGSKILSAKLRWSLGNYLVDACVSLSLAQQPIRSIYTSQL